ncbi:MAG: ferredoxin--NADP reductase, partial [Mycolicibacterium sp.]|nr:ferredoxin--NADP reductase [Mycolicibacterium sp.]
MARDHGFHETRITRVIQETPETRTYVLDAPFPYRAGQFVTFRVSGTLRSYSMSSSPDTDTELMTTVKRVPGGLVSNWMYDNLAAGDVVEVTAPAGVFCLRETRAPLIAFAGGSGITPIISLAKSALATTERTVRILAANRDAESVIFRAALDDLAERYPERFEVRYHLDMVAGFIAEAEVLDFAGPDESDDFYLCGPAPFMNLIERVLLARGTDPGCIFIERFAPGEEPGTGAADAEPPAGRGESRAAGTSAVSSGGTITIILDGKQASVARTSGITLLQSARRAGLTPPFSCEAGNCATCIGRVTEGEVKMRANNALDDDEVADGWTLTCQGEPVTQ